MLWYICMFYRSSVTSIATSFLLVIPPSLRATSSTCLTPTTMALSTSKSSSLRSLSRHRELWKRSCTVSLLLLNIWCRNASTSSSINLHTTERITTPKYTFAKQSTDLAPFSGSLVTYWSMRLYRAYWYDRQFSSTFLCCKTTHQALSYNTKYTCTEHWWYSPPQFMLLGLIGVGHGHILITLPSTCTCIHSFSDLTPCTCT